VTVAEVLAVLSCGLLILAPAVDGRDFAPRCNAVTKARAGALDIDYRLKCNFGVESFSIRSSRAIDRVARRSRPHLPDPGERVRCRRASTRVARCEAYGTSRTVRGAFGSYGVRGSPCAGLRTRFEASGGVDCKPGDSCIDIGYAVRVRVPYPRGC
jgi:hypothetical protein